MYNSFAGKDENHELPGSEWDYKFSEQNGITKVHIMSNESRRVVLSNADNCRLPTVDC